MFYYLTMFAVLKQLFGRKYVKLYFYQERKVFFKIIIANSFETETSTWQPFKKNSSFSEI